MQFLPLVLMATLMYGLVIRPQRRRVADQRALLASVTVGDRVLTTSGMFGVITHESGDVVRVSVAPGVELHLARGAIARKLDASMPDAPGTEALLGADHVIHLDALHAAEAGAESGGIDDGSDGSDGSDVPEPPTVVKKRGFGGRGLRP